MGNDTMGGSGIFAVTAYLHVADVDRSIAFYELLGLVADTVYREGGEEQEGNGSEGASAGGPAFWASMHGRVKGARVEGSRLMLARASGPIDPGVQAALLYMYSQDVRSLAETLRARGVPSLGRFMECAVGQAAGIHDYRAVYDVTQPHYMPAGELRVHDPDGYVVLIGQLQ